MGREMNVLNLIDEKRGDISYEILSFPDGQHNTQINTWNITNSCSITCRITSFKDVEILACAKAALKSLGFNDIKLNVTYFLGARSDRRFLFGQAHYLSEVICPIINSMEFSTVRVLDPHSDVLGACLKNFKALDNHQFVKWALESINNTNTAQERIVFISPDAGAAKKIYSVADSVNFSGEVIIANKQRDNKGQIVKTELPHYDITKDSVIIDDICDGGRTFIEIAKIIRGRQEDYERKAGQLPVGKIYLVVTHGVFSKGLNELCRYFDGILTTNSYRDWKSDGLLYVKTVA